MSENTDCIIKSGVVESIDVKSIKVKIHNQSACSMCYSKGVCTSLGSGERIIDVENDHKHNLMPGDTVDIQMISSSGNMAVVFGYVLPFVILITALLISSTFLKEVVAGIVSLAVLVPYYLILYMTRKKMKKYFRFTLV
jgi:sigma-E factor negative regulatory protein RseC